MAAGCCLGQLDGENNIHPIAFRSKKLNPSQQKCASPPCLRLQRWVLAIQCHDIEANHIKGSKLVNADALSRL
ncbi:hypothetical protein TNCV_2188541 [Trichonephila clavipes]|nr:hypothetical protein TNCV_2188541 [Trichonephila clavipes]